MILDNLSTSTGEKVRQAIEGRGCQLLFLPSYSPDLSPIEEAFSKLKAFYVRREHVPHNAIVVRKWENRVPKTGGTVYLTNDPVTERISLALFGIPDRLAAFLGLATA